MTMSRHPDITFITDYIKNVLYFAVFKSGRVPVDGCNTHYFCIDDDLIYENYFLDFGPLNISCVYKFCKLLNDKINLRSRKQVLIHYTTTDPKKKANAAFLLGCFGVLYLSMSADQAFKPLLHGQYMPFQDACPQKSPYTITILNCLEALVKARDLNFFNFQDFNVAEYIKFDTFQGGDLNWIVPGKFLAFIGPVDNVYSAYHPPEMYVDYFNQNNVKVVIRLNKKQYDNSAFTKNGILHYDLFFPDGSCPQKHILMKFLEISEETTGAIAVHCKAGLGRTGTLIGSYLIKHYRMTAHEAIAWMRICRPGSVIGHQQEWLEKVEAWLIKQGNMYRRRRFQDVNLFPRHDFGIYSFFKTKYLSKPMFSKSPPPLSTKKPSAELSSALRPLISRRRDEDVEKKIERKEFNLHQKAFPQNQTIIINEKSYYNGASSKLPSKMKCGDDSEIRMSRPASRFSKHLKQDFLRNDKANKVDQNSRVSQYKQSQLRSFIKVSTPQYPCYEFKTEPTKASIVLEKVLKKRKTSVGAVSLGSQRSALLENRASSIRSDERPTATQGDLLNSIKFCRRLKECVKADRHLKTADKIFMTSDRAACGTSYESKARSGQSPQKGGYVKLNDRSNPPKIRRPAQTAFH